VSQKERLHWKNWAGNQQCTPERIERPATEQGLVRIVKQAAAAGQRVKVVGSGHSFTGIALTDGRLVKLDDYRRVLSIDREKQTASVQAGITIARLSEQLDKQGLALENLGDINYQSISGAISTATHGDAGDRLAADHRRWVDRRLLRRQGTRHFQCRTGRAGCARNHLDRHAPLC